jgi:predicted dienelactone hydrolase
MPGFQFIEVPAGADRPALKGAMWYPCSGSPGEIDLGKITATFEITVRGAKNPPISGDKLPLVVVSHGKGSHFVLHRDTAETLADAGFVVAGINHPGDTVFDMSRSGDLSAMVERPTDIKRLVDFMLFISPAASRIDPQRIGFFGFSFGGYTALVFLGAYPDWAVFTAERQRLQSPLPPCEQVRRKEFPTQPLAHDARIKPSSPTLPPFSLPSTALWPPTCRSSCGCHSMVVMACRPRASPPWREACRRSTNITWCRTPDTSPS